MIYFIYLILIFNFLFFLISLLNFIFNKIYLKKLKNSLPKENALVSVLIPARNEEKNIGNLLNDLINQDYKNIEIIVFNDCSTDKTKEIVKDFISKDKRISLIDSNYLPDGWLGKNFACYNLAKKAKGEYFLFLDADVRIKGNLIQDAISLIKNEKISFLSIFPTQKMFTLGEYLTVPVIYYILLSLLPFILVPKSKYSSLSAAIGQFMLFKKEIYLKYNLHEKFKQSIAEDLEIARYLKKNNERILCLTGDERLECRMYQGLNDAINGFSRTIKFIFGNSYLLLILFWIINFYSLILATFFFISYEFLLILILFVLNRYFVFKLSRQNVFLNLILSPLQVFFLAFIIYRSIIGFKKRNIIWKDRVL